jgi:CO dehydrogenase/acetyl-CoA synthase delta subunit
MDTPVGPVPKVKTTLETKDMLGTIRARFGYGRNDYKVAPGLYCVGAAGPDSPVLVTANYKMSFDYVRRELDGVDAWILVLDTRGINVWCAAGKAFFSTQELVKRIGLAGLDKVVRHREIVLPQLGATGVSAVDVKKNCGFKVIWGPILARDIKRFLSSDYQTGPSMRRVTFTMGERLVVVPIELTALWKPSIWMLSAFFILSGIGTHIFSIGDAWFRGLMLAAAYGAGIFAGAVVAPVFLPWIPGRAFSVKGTITGLVIGAGVIWLLSENIDGWEPISMLLFTLAVSSYLAMNFTGSTPFTSPSGVEKEMRRAIPIQVAALFIAAVAWVGSGFAG